VFDSSSRGGGGGGGGEEDGGGGAAGGVQPVRARVLPERRHPAPPPALLLLPPLPHRQRVGEHGVRGAAGRRARRGQEARAVHLRRPRQVPLPAAAALVGTPHVCSVACRVSLTVVVWVADARDGS
jgi:hypothetical protein